MSMYCTKCADEGRLEELPFMQGGMSIIPSCPVHGKIDRMYTVYGLPLALRERLAQLPVTDKVSHREAAAAWSQIKNLVPMSDMARGHVADLDQFFAQ